jgi:predicted AlkP superfamily phosphohydrolase/phosphomutase
LGPDSIRTWKQLEEQFHIQYHSEAAEAGIADLAQVRQKRRETMVEYIQRVREVKNRCYSTQISEKAAVELASLELLKPIKDLVFQL